MSRRVRGAALAASDGPPARRPRRERRPARSPSAPRASLGTFATSLPRDIFATTLPGDARPAHLIRPVAPVGGPPARSPHTSFARSDRSRSPARPRRRPQAPQPGPAGLAPPTGRPLLFRVPSTPARSRRREYPSQAPPPPTGTTARHDLHAHTRKAAAAQETSTPRPATASSMKRQMS